MRYAAATLGGIGFGLSESSVGVSTTASAAGVLALVVSVGVDCPTGGTVRFAGASFICSSTRFDCWDLGVVVTVSLPAAFGLVVLGLSA